MYTELSDEDKLETAINFVAVGQSLPEPLVEFLKSAGLYEAITLPRTVLNEQT
jgi:hypothetical protein